MQAPTIAFCTTCKGRAQHLKLTLPKNLLDNSSYSNCKFVIVDYNSHDDLLAYLRTAHESAIDSGRVVVYSYRHPTPFRMAHAKNMAHRCGLLEGADILVNLDADNYTGEGFASYIAAQFSMEPNIFLWARMVKEGDDRLPRGISGRIAVTKHAFLNTGGYDEKYDTWSPDDKDFNARLWRLGYQGREIQRRFLDGVLHNDKMRFKEYRHVQTHKGSDQFDLAGEEHTIANYGNIGRGIVYRNFGDAPVELTLLPTRIFGIGLHKTATTSLHKALTILGYDSAHWTNAHWAKAIWREMSEHGYSRTLEAHYALSDLPIPLFFRELDQAYPGSKFILTMRQEDRWLKSVRNHFDPAHNIHRARWDTDPFSNKVHSLLYGRKKFDAEVMLVRYRRHYMEVKVHFMDRPADLLEMNMDAGAGWTELCHFLGQPVPSLPYPREFATQWNEEEGGSGI